MGKEIFRGVIETLLVTFGVIGGGTVIVYSISWLIRKSKRFKNNNCGGIDNDE